jgi:hypothetical protein
MAHRLAGRESFESITLGANAQIESNVCDRGDSHLVGSAKRVGPPGSTLLRAPMGPAGCRYAG